MTRKDSKNKFDINIGYDDIYNHYKKTSSSSISKEKYNAVFNDVFNELMDMVIKKGYNLKFPHKFGNLEIQKKKQKIVYNTDGTVNKICYKVDWKSTKEYWNKIYGDLSKEELKTITNKPKIYCKNKYRMKFKYIKNDACYKGKSLVMFIPTRKWCRELANHLKTNPYATDYKEQ
jgi:nucleoid DNA-binding protein